MIENHSRRAMLMKRIILHLYIEVKNTQRSDLVKFLREARSFYEQIPGATLRLLQNRRTPEQFIEIVEYASTDAYEQDNVRVQYDSTMKRYLSRWKLLLSGPVKVEVYDDITGELK